MNFDAKETFQRALMHHQRGQLAQAQALYEQLLQHDLRHFDSLHLLGLVFVQQGDAERGVSYIAQALAVRSDFPEAHYNMGNAQLSLQKPADALRSFDRAIALNSRDPQYHFERGNALKDLGHDEEALASYETALRIFPGYAEAHNNIGIVLKEAGRLDEALARYDMAIALKPDYPEAHGNRGNALKDIGQLLDAMASYDTALRLKPDYAEAYSNRGNALAQLKLWNEALAGHDRAITLRPDYAEGYNNRGIVLKELGRAAEAVLSYDTAIRLKPSYAEAYSNRGNALKDLKRVAEALASYDKANELQPDYAEAYLNRGNLLKDLGRLDDAFANYDKAAGLKPSLRQAHFNKSLIALQRHDFQDGFDLYQWRWDGDPSSGDTPQTAIPKWDGSLASGEILLWAEQGLGDEVFFASMLSLLDHQAQKFAVSADARLHPVYQRSFPGVRLVDSVLTRKSIQGEFAAQMAIGDLGRVLRVDEPRIRERRYPYLVPSAERRARLASVISPPEGDLICGLSWRSGNKKVGAERSLDLSDLAPVLKVPGVTFVNLQYGDVSADIEKARNGVGIGVMQVEGLDVFGDIDGLLALIDLCDVVVTIDNVTAHLAGAVGKTSVVLVPSDSGRHWYWGGEMQSLWYPSLNLYYQQTGGDWAQAVVDASQWVAQAARRARAE